MRAGSTLLDRGGVTVRLRNIIRHPKFDAALLRHMNRLKFSRFLQPIALPNADKVIRDGEQCITSGWGQTSENEFIHDYNRRLKAVIIPFIGHDHCNKLLNSRLKILNEEVCLVMNAVEKMHAMEIPAVPSFIPHLDRFPNEQLLALFLMASDVPFQNCLEFM